ncbi:prepilin peptidase [Paenibacillus sp. NPDC057967]|uniref:A24 family peptidase n=1 Tax=Paenibacillus sp. NPDC057967 TaxID=3346293 RepID=UPI0036DBCFC4
MTMVLWAAAGQLLIAFITDMRHQMISNWLTGTSFVLGMLYHVLAGGIEAQGWLYAAAGAAAGFIPLLILYAFGGIGAGDVKLFGALGAWIGAAMIAQLMMYSILYAGAFGVLMLAFNRAFAKRMAALMIIAYPGAARTFNWFEWARSGKSFPFMLAVAPAAITVWMMG